MRNFHSILNQLPARPKVYPNITRRLALQQQSFHCCVGNQCRGAHAIRLFFVCLPVITVHHLAALVAQLEAHGVALTTETYPRAFVDGKLESKQWVKLLPPTPKASGPRTGYSCGSDHATSTGAQRSPYRSGSPCTNDPDSSTSAWYVPGERTGETPDAQEYLAQMQVNQKEN